MMLKEVGAHVWDLQIWRWQRRRHTCYPVLQSIEILRLYRALLMYSQHWRSVHSPVTGTSRTQVTSAGTKNPQVQICNVCMLCKISCHASNLFLPILSLSGAWLTKARGERQRRRTCFPPKYAYLKCTATPKMLFFVKFGALNSGFTPIYLRPKTIIIAGQHEFPHLFCVEVNTFEVYPKLNYQNTRENECLQKSALNVIFKQILYVKIYTYMHVYLCI